MLVPLIAHKHSEPLRILIGIFAESLPKAFQAQWPIIRAALLHALAPAKFPAASLDALPAPAVQKTTEGNKEEEAEGEIEKDVEATRDEQEEEEASSDARENGVAHSEEEEVEKENEEEYQAEQESAEATSANEASEDIQGAENWQFLYHVLHSVEKALAWIFFFF